MIRARLLPVVLPLLLLLPVEGWATPPRFELIYTQPIETTLVQPLRAPGPLWAEVFAGASRSIDIEQFYLADQKGQALEPVLAALEKAARRGVRVRVLVEEKFRKQSQPTLDRLRAWPHTEVRMIAWDRQEVPPGRQRGGIVHAKFWIVDGKLGYLGSQNFDWRSLSQIQELGVLIRDTRIAGQLQAIFAMDWQAADLQARGQPVPLPPPHDTTPVRDDLGYLVASPPERLPPGVVPSEPELLALLASAQKRLQIQVMKYEPLDHDKRYYGAIDQVLRAAAARGVKVELLVSDWNADQPGQRWLQSLAVVPGVQVRMVTIPQASSGFVPFSRVVHAKYAVVDDQVLWVGTSNWQGGYFNESRNVELVLRLPALAGQAAAIHAQLWASPYAQPLEACREYPRVKRDAAR